MMRPAVTDFDASAVTPFKMLRSMPAELRGVVTNLHDALKELRSCVFRAGKLVLTDGQVATQAWLEADVLARALPVILQSGFMARDDEGALFSPHLYARVLRKEEREARKAHADAQWQHWQDSGEMPDGLSRQQAANRKNAQMAGRPRKAETREQAYERRMKEKAHGQAQRDMPLMCVHQEGEIENRNRKSKPFSISIDLESERDNIPSSSISGEIGNPKSELDDALVRKVAARVLAVSGMSDQASYAVSLSRRWLSMGATEATIIAAIQEHQAAIRANGEEPRRLKVFEAAVLRGIEAQQIVGAVPQSRTSEAPQTKEMQQFSEVWGRATRVWKEAFAECRDYGAIMRQWPELAQAHGLPDLPYEREAYLQHFCSVDVAA
jgi:hypothetical protein